MKIFYLFVFATLVWSCNNQSAASHTANANVIGSSETDVLNHPEWSKNATMYEVNIRQHTIEGTFAAFEKDIPRLKQMGITLLWLMPIHPIGIVNRKGSLGSYYSVRDYKGVNPEFGTEDDFRRMIKTAHDNGMKIIIDWVANHSSFDNIWTVEKKSNYALDTAGSLQPPFNTDWWDVAQLDWTNKQVWADMKDAMKFWIREYDIDGFRCDVAEKVPTPFWEETRQALDSIKPVFMLAEAEIPEMHNIAFDMTYGWEMMHIMNEMAKGKKSLEDVDVYMDKERRKFISSAYRMYFTTNHDENSWQGTGDERYGKARKVYDVMAFTMWGMPLLYTSQEGGETKRLKFFDKDTCEWNGYKEQDFYSRLIQLRTRNKALWSGAEGGDFRRVKTSSDEVIYAFIRTKGESQVLVMLNFSDKPQKIGFIEDIKGNFSSIFNQQTLSVFTQGDVKLDPYGYQVFELK
ncbi:MAG: alpha-amylase family glycosyl hydrolase [Flavobacteriales bacterium]|nr:alpha-amylase family glycosyl hydrolase [Flavobacteriales bacterium]